MEKVQCIFEEFEKNIVDKKCLGLDRDEEMEILGLELTFKNLLEHYLKSNNFIIKTSDENYYSGYQNPINIAEKDFVWMSSKLDQALLHPFERLKIDPTSPKDDMFEPYLYKFLLNRPIKILVSQDLDNEKIFKFNFDILQKIIKPKGSYVKYGVREEHKIIVNFNEVIRTINKKCYDDNERDFKISNNLKILQYIKALNMIIDKYYPHIQKIDGYMNEHDQIEVAVINFSGLLESTSLKSSRVLGIEISNFANKSFNFSFPFNFVKTWEEFQDTNGFNYSILLGNFIRYAYLEYNKYLMIAKKGIKINYQDFDDNSNIVAYLGTSSKELFKINSIELTGQKIGQESINWKNKYLKYKNKYLELKKKINII